MILVSESAIIRRINRVFSRRYYYENASELEKVHACSCRSQWRCDLGRFYTVDEARNHGMRSHVDLGQLAREVGVLNQSEEVAS